MKATLYFLVKVLDDYNDSVEMSDGTKLAVNNSIDSVEHINRVGKLIDAPKGSIVNKGDLLLFHHNICRQAWGLKGKKRKSDFHVRDQIFYVPVTEIFMYMPDSEWIAIDPFVFVKPLKAKMKTLSNGLVVEEDSYEGMKDLVGEMAYPNKELVEQGVVKGDLVAFQQDSQHKYTLKGEIYYRMKTQDILGVYGRT